MSYDSLEGDYVVLGSNYVVVILIQWHNMWTIPVNLSQHFVIRDKKLVLFVIPGPSIQYHYLISNISAQNFAPVLFEFSTDNLFPIMSAPLYYVFNFFSSNLPSLTHFPIKFSLISMCFVFFETFLILEKNIRSSLSS